MKCVQGSYIAGKPTVGRAALVGVMHPNEIVGKQDLVITMEGQVGTKVKPHPITYTPHPEPYTLYPTPSPCTLHPTVYTLHPTPYTLHPTPYTPKPQTPNPKPRNQKFEASNPKP